MRYIRLFSLTLFTCLALNAQEVTAGIYGTVRDSSSAVIPSAAVALHNVATGRDYQATSDQSGNYTMTLIPVGSYEVYATAAGFKKGTFTGLTLAVNDNRRIDFSLDVGQMTEQVTVSADLVQVNTANGTTNSIISEAKLEGLPSTARAVAPFVLLMPGVVNSTPTSASNNYASVNGVRPTHNAWTLDGGYDIDTGGNWDVFLPPNMEIIAEVNAIRGNYSAEFGTGGGSQFNMISKSGTNEIHGSAYEFLQNNDLQARQYFQPTVPILRYNDFGFTIGGPVYIPKVYNGKNKTFFFANIDWIWQGSSLQFLDIVPTPAQRAGNYSATNITVKDPLTGSPFPGNIIPSSRIDPNAAAYAAVYPAPNFHDSLGDNYFANDAGVNHHHQWTLRMDHNFSDKYRITARWTDDLVNNLFGITPGGAHLQEDAYDVANHLTVDQTSTLRPNLINDFNLVRIANRLENRFPGALSPAGTGVNIPELFPINAQTYPLNQLALSSVPQRIPGVSLTNYTSMAPSTPWANYENVYDIKDSLTWIKGRHTIKTGFDITHEEKSEPAVYDVWGVFTFNGAQTGDAFADLLLGKSASFTESNTVAYNDNVRESYEAYVDDSWKVTSRLTVELGLRYSLFPPAKEASNRYRVFDPAAYNPAQAVTLNSAGQIVAGSGNPLNGIVNPAGLWGYPKANFAPRVGFAYDPMGNGKTSIRGGYGLFYSREILGAFILMAGNPPFEQQALIYNALLSNPSNGSSANTPVTIGSNDLHQNTPYTEQFNFNIQHTLSSNLILEIGYAGSHGLHMMRTIDINQPLPQVGIANGTLNANLYRPYQGYGIIEDRQQSYASKYNALQASLSRRFAHGLMFKANYTWSKALDNTDCCSGNIYNPIPDSYNYSYEWGRSSFDAEQNFIADYVWEIPFLLGRNDLVGKTLGGWQLSGITTFQSGLPNDITIGKDDAGVGSAQGQRPQVLSNPNLGFGNRTAAEWFNPAEWVAPPLGTFATTGRNLVSIPGTNNWDMSLHKTFKLYERMNLQFRADAFNPFNHTEFMTVGKTITTPAQFGKVTAAKNARNLMLGLRLEW